MNIYLYLKLIKFLHGTILKCTIVNSDIFIVDSPYWDKKTLVVIEPWNFIKPLDFAGVLWGPFSNYSHF